jgi:hypothetical protein
LPCDQRGRRDGPPRCGGPMLDHDVAASGFPPIPDQPVAVDRFLDARGALLLCACALEVADRARVLAVLGGLRAGLSITEVMEALEGLVGR